MGNIVGNICVAADEVPKDASSSPALSSLDWLLVKYIISWDLVYPSMRKRQQFHVIPNNRNNNY